MPTRCHQCPSQSRLQPPPSPPLKRQLPPLRELRLLQAASPLLLTLLQHPVWPTTLLPAAAAMLLYLRLLPWWLHFGLNPPLPVIWARVQPGRPLQWLGVVPERQRHRLLHACGSSYFLASGLMLGLLRARHCFQRHRTRWRRWMREAAAGSWSYGRRGRGRGRGQRLSKPW